MSSGILRYLVLLGVLCALAGAAPVYQFTEFTVPGATHLAQVHINNAGYVTALGFDADWTNLRSVLWDGSAYTFLTGPGGELVVATDINNSGLIVGGGNDGAGQAIGFTLVAGAYSIYHDASRQPYLGFWGSNDAGLIVGMGGFGETGYATSFVYDGVTTTDLPSDPVVTDPVAMAINNAGVIVGNYGLVGSWGTAGTYSEHAFTYSDGVYTTVAYPGATRTNLVDINNFGWAIGQWSDGSGGEGGFLYRDEVFIPLPNMVVSSPWGPLEISPWYESINDNGVVAGTRRAWDAEGNYYKGGFIGDPVPEPASVALIGAGVLALAGLGRRRTLLGRLFD